MPRRLENKRVLVTCADKFRGPAIEKLFKAEAALVQTRVDSLLDQESVDGVLSTCGDIDVLIANRVGREIMASSGIDSVAQWTDIWQY